MPCETFPRVGQTDVNPAIALFGNRLFKDQVPTELLCEFLLVAYSPKRIGSDGTPIESSIPTATALREWARSAPLCASEVQGRPDRHQ